MLVKMKEIPVVEGKNDINVLKSFLDCDIIETNGTHLGKEILRQIRLAQKTRGAIIFTNLDSPGEKVRSCINATVLGCKNTFIDRAEAKTSKKVGVEHARKGDILKALARLMISDEYLQVTLSHEEYLDLGLNGREGNAEKRAQIARSPRLGRPNAKTFFKCLNMLQLHKTGVEKLPGQPYE